MNSQRSREGYLLVDHRAGPGLGRPGETPLAHGTLFEAPTYTCSHCQRVVVVNPNRTRERGYCRKCDRLVCDACEAGRAASGGACHAMGMVFDIAQEAAERGVPVEQTIETLRRTIHG